VAVDAGAADTGGLSQLRYARVINELARPFDPAPEINPHNILLTLVRRRTVAAALFPPPNFKLLDKNGHLFYAFDESGRRRWASQDELPGWLIEVLFWKRGGV